MANKRSVALTQDEYKNIIQVMRTGFYYNGVNYKKNNRIATILVMEANLGLRIGDILKLRLCDIIKDGGRYRLSIVEQKTNKSRNYTVPLEIYIYLQEYALENGIRQDARLFPITSRAVEKHLKQVALYLGLNNIGTHSFRKFYATEIYKNNNYNIVLVQELLQHSSAAITQRYIGIQQKDLEDAISKHINLL